VIAVIEVVGVAEVVAEDDEASPLVMATAGAMTLEPLTWTIRVLSHPWVEARFTKRFRIVSKTGQALPHIS